jgi:hypothetical protein
MSYTPRTDAVAAHEGNWDTKALRMTHHAKQLERELAKAQECLTETIHALKKYGYGIRPMAADDISRWRKAAGLEDTK